jgi:hypothetical protein
VVMLISFHGHQSLKADVIARVTAHAIADEIIKGRYWEDGKGCFIGCVLHSDKHSEFETRYGIPTWMAKLCDVIFEGLPNGEAKKFAVEFWEAAPIGVDLNPLQHQFAVFVQRENLERVQSLDIAEALKTEVIGVIRRVMELHAKEFAAESAAKEFAAESAAWSAAESAAWSAAESAAWSAAFIRYRDELLWLLRESGPARTG